MQMLSQQKETLWLYLVQEHSSLMKYREKMHYFMGCS